MDRIDPLFYAHSSRIPLGDETRIKATSEEAQKWEEENKASPEGQHPYIFQYIEGSDSSFQPLLRTSSQIFST